MNRLIIAFFLVSIILINIPLFKSKKITIIPPKVEKIPELVLKKPLNFPKTNTRVNMYRSEKTQYDYI